ncbi:MAG: hypothetical protein KC547_13520, partial [Anaerolineae bacterium]|nr:hypothetical protein [Anaerolineae bacterium]
MSHVNQFSTSVCRGWAMKRSYVVIIASLVLLLGIMSGLYLMQLTKGRALDPSLVPTAEYLAQQPMPLPNYIVRTHPAHMGVLAEDQTVCVDFTDIVDTDLTTLHGGAEFRINGQPLPWFYGVEWGSVGGQIFACVKPPLGLTNGLHLIELRTKLVSGIEAD